MKSFVGLLAHIDNTELAVGLSVVAALGAFAFWKKWFASKAAAWPIVAAKIENVFVVSSTRGIKGPRYETSNAVLAYSYSIGAAFYSGEIKLAANDTKAETIEKELVRQNLSVHYNPRKPQKAIFLEGEVKVGRLLKILGFPYGLGSIIRDEVRPRRRALPQLSCDI